MKNCLVITRHAPYGTALGREGLDAVLMASAFTGVSYLFMDDGVFQLLRNQSAGDLAIKDYSPVFELLEQYDINKVYAARHSLTERGIDTNDLLISPELLEDAEITELIQVNDFILTF